VTWLIQSRTCSQICVTRGCERRNSAATSSCERPIPFTWRNTSRFRSDGIRRFTGLTANGAFSSGKTACAADMGASRRTEMVRVYSSIQTNYLPSRGHVAIPFRAPLKRKQYRTHHGDLNKNPADPGQEQFVAI